MMVLAQVENLYTFFTSNVVHPTLFPYHIVPSLHAARISIAFQNNVRSSGNYEKLSWGIYLSGFLVMAWSASIQTHYLLSIPPPHVYSVHPWVNYLSVHLVLTAFFHLFPAALTPRFFDTLLFLPDAILRTASITSSLDLIQSHPDPRLAGSLFLRILVGAVSSAGGSMTAATLGVWTPSWAFSTPVFLRREATVLSTLDLWSGSLAGCTYGLLLASHPVYQSLLMASSLVDHSGPVVSPLAAKAVVTVMLAALFAWRVMQIHWVQVAEKPKSK